jgi:hypothetical protein
MPTAVETFIAHALAFVGYREGPNNDTPFGRRTGHPNQAWCDSWVSCVAQDVGLDDVIPMSAYVPARLAAARVTGHVASTPQRGDLVCFDWNHDQVPDHIAVVLAADATTLHTVEGNTSSGTGGQTFTGAGSVALAPIRAAGAGDEAFSGAGSVALAPLATAGAGSETFTCTGTVALAPLSVSGSGAAGSAPVTSTGTVALAPLAVMAFQVQPTITSTGGASFAGLAIAAYARVARDITVTAGLKPSPWIARLSSGGTVDASSTEYVVAEIGSNHDISTDVVEVSFDGKLTWHPAEIVPSSTRPILHITGAIVGYVMDVRVLVGPVGGVTTLTDSTSVACRVRDLPEMPVIPAGMLRVTA